jgi:hypothetical protein
MPGLDGAAPEQNRVVAFSDYPGRIYHGLSEQDANGGSPIAVERSGGGPTEREQAERLGYLDSPDTYYGPRSFWWGYAGSSAHDAAQALLADALGVQPDPGTVSSWSMWSRTCPTRPTGGCLVGRSCAGRAATEPNSPTTRTRRRMGEGGHRDRVHRGGGSAGRNSTSSPGWETRDGAREHGPLFAVYSLITPVSGRVVWQVGTRGFRRTLVLSARDATSFAEVLRQAVPLALEQRPHLHATGYPLPDEDILNEAAAEDAWYARINAWAQELAWIRGPAGIQEKGATSPRNHRSAT